MTAVSWEGSTIVVDITDLGDGRYMARSQHYPGWRPEPSEMIDKPALERSLKTHRSRHTRVEFDGWDGRVWDDAMAGKRASDA